jgi:atypical dual specificity phosphatase
LTPSPALESQPVLQTVEYGVAFADKIVLASITVNLPSRGLVALVGPGGAGKSTFLRMLAGLNDQRPALRTWGTADFEGRPLGTGRRPTLVQQNFRLLTSSVRENVVFELPNRDRLSLLDQGELLTSLFRSLGIETLASDLDREVVGMTLCEQRMIALARAYLLGAPLMCVDEPDAGLKDYEADALLTLLLRIAEQRSVLWVTHHQARAKRFSAFTALLAGGRLLEFGGTAAFFANPQTAYGREFLATGGCSVPSPMATAEELDAGVKTNCAPPVAYRALTKSRPVDFYWLKPGILGGVPRPGILASLEEDLEGLRRLGITVLVTLEETRTVPSETLAAYGIQSLFFPITDMDVPKVEDALRFCDLLNRMVQAGKIVALHCRAGMGRTGAMLACYLISNGSSAVAALERAREMNPHWVQSDRQVQFLSEFANNIAVPDEGNRV